jgi:imidazolonepropionase-like amidohydrolase
MKILATAILLISALFIFAENATENVIALRAARLWDGRSNAPVSNGVVIVSNDKVLNVGSIANIPSGAKVVDLGDATLLPGFIDLHVHTSGELGQNFLQSFYEGLRMTVAEKALRASVYARRMLDAGFTTVRNLGSPDRIDAGLRNAINKGFVIGPRIVAATNPLGARGGHCDETGFPEGTFGEETAWMLGSLRVQMLFAMQFVIK